MRLYAQRVSDKSTLSSHATQTMLTNHIILSHWHRAMIAVLQLLHPLSSVLELLPGNGGIGLEDKLKRLSTNR